METIIKKAIEGGWNPNKIDLSIPQNRDWFIKNVDKKKAFLDPFFWQALFKNKKDEWGARQRFFSILFGDNGEIEGWEKAVAYLQQITNIK